MKTTCLFLFLTLAGCAGGPAYEDSPKLRTCKYEATKATAGQNNYGGRTVVGSAYGEYLAYKEILAACMAQ